MTLYTFQEYAKLRGLSRQRIYKIKDRLKVVELEVFAEYNGIKKSLGKQQFIVDICK